MSENIPESVPTSVSHRSNRPLKRRAVSPTSQQHAQVEALFANPDRADTVIPMGPKSKVALAPPEIVANVQGSSAGAGSGEFHVYKASRRREYERLRIMDEETKQEEAEKAFQAKKEQTRKADEEKLSKNRAKREKAKMRAAKKKAGGKDAMEVDEGVKHPAHNGVQKKLGPAKVALPSNGSRQEAEDDAEAEAVPEEIGIQIHDDD